MEDKEMKCQHCGKSPAKCRRQGSAYVDDEKNFAILCDECQEEAHEYWRERWQEYYDTVMG